MKVKYFADTDTALLEFSDHPPVETREINENLYIDVDAQGRVVSVTIEHAHNRFRCRISPIPNHANVTGWPTEKPAQKIIAQQIAAASGKAHQPPRAGLNIPKLGINMPNMGTKAKTRIFKVQKRASLADALFSATRQRVLAYLFGQPERSFFATELIKLAGGGSGAVQRELARLADSALVTVTRVGTQKHYQANPKSPICAELCAIAQKTVGLAEPLREALAPLAQRLTAAFVFGSVAKRSDTATSDIDVLVLSDSVDYADVFAVFQSAEAKLGRTVNPTVYTPANWRKKQKEGNAFVVKVAAQPKVFLIGTEEDLA